MRKRKSSNVSSQSQRQNWDKVFNRLVQMLSNQQKQLESLANDRKFLEDRLRMQHEGWASDIRLLKDQISEMKGILMIEEQKRLLEVAKADLMLGSKNREASICKWNLEQIEDELADFRASFECLSRKSSNGEDQETAFKDTDKGKEGTTDSNKKSIGNNAKEEKCPKKFEGEFRRLKIEYEKLALEKSSEVSALLAEKKFVWNQYNIMENDYANKLRSKQAEVEKANEKIEILISSMEQLQSANNEKDSTISELESKVASMEADTKRLNEEISRLSVELESLRKSRNNQVSPVLSRCTAGIKTSGSGIIKSSRSRGNVTSKKELCTPDGPAPAKVSEKGTRSLKRKGGPVIPINETPKLFSSNFKVPKLKPSLRVGWTSLH